jgi:hypothetical protein
VVSKEKVQPRSLHDVTRWTLPPSGLGTWRNRSSAAGSKPGAALTFARLLGEGVEIVNPVQMM